MGGLLHLLQLVDISVLGEHNSVPNVLVVLLFYLFLHLFTYDGELGVVDVLVPVVLTDRVSYHSWRRYFVDEVRFLVEGHVIGANVASQLQLQDKFAMTRDLVANVDSALHNKEYF